MQRLIILLIFLFWFPKFGNSCICRFEINFIESAKKSDFIVLGKIIDNKKVLRVKVIKYFKGNLKNKFIDIVTPCDVGCGICSDDFSKGNFFLLSFNQGLDPENKIIYVFPRCSFPAILIENNLGYGCIENKNYSHKNRCIFPIPNAIKSANKAYTKKLNKKIEKMKLENILKKIKN